LYFVFAISALNSYLLAYPTVLLRLEID